MTNQESKHTAHVVAECTLDVKSGTVEDVTAFQHSHPYVPNLISIDTFLAKYKDGLIKKSRGFYFGIFAKTAYKDDFIRLKITLPNLPVQAGDIIVTPRWIQNHMSKKHIYVGWLPFSEFVIKKLESIEGSGKNEIAAL